MIWDTFSLSFILREPVRHEEPQQEECFHLCTSTAHNLYSAGGCRRCERHTEFWLQSLTHVINNYSPLIHLLTVWVRRHACYPTAWMWTRKSQRSLRYICWWCAYKRERSNRQTFSHDQYDTISYKSNKHVQKILRQLSPPLLHFYFFLQLIRIGLAALFHQFPQNSNIRKTITWMRKYLNKVEQKL